MSSEAEDILPSSEGESDEIDSLLDGTQLEARARDQDGKYSAEKRRLRKPQVPNFAIIEAVDDPESSGPEEGGSAAQASRVWRIRGPVRGFSDDGWRMSTVTFVRARETMACLEVYVRSMGLLVSGAYVDVADAYASVKFVAAAQTAAQLSWDTTSPTSSFRGLLDGQKLRDEDVALVLQQAADSLASSPEQLSHGHVQLVRRTAARQDPEHMLALQRMLRQRSRAAIADFRRKGADMMKQVWHQLLRGVGAQTVAMIRRVIELDDNRAPGTSARSRRSRVSRGYSQMRLLPTAAQLREERRRAFDGADRIGHYFFTRGGPNELLQWNYIRGSGSQGIRRYRCVEGDVKRLRGYNNRYWEGSPAGEEQEVGGAEAEDSSDYEDDGIHYNNDNVETEGCYAPQEKDSERLKELLAHSRSYLENDDGGGELVILAVAFDAPLALQRGIDMATLRGTEGADAAANVPAVVTFAADGGMVRGKTVTAFVAGIAWPGLSAGRTDLVPLAYSFSGEKHIDKLVAKAVRDMVQEIMRTSFTVEVQTAEGSVDAVGDAPEKQRVPLQLYEEVQVCGVEMRTAKALTHFALACLPGSVQEMAKATLLAIVGKGSMEAIYMREFRELVAHCVARLDILSRDLDRVFIILLQLVQLMNAAWRASLADADAMARIGASSVTRLAASILGPLYQEVKPLDPDTQGKQVFSLYLHAPIAHLHRQVGANRGAVAHVSDDVMEGHIRGVGRYTYNHGNNASQAALMSDMVGLCDATVKFSTPRSHPSSLVYTKYIQVCECWKTLGVQGTQDYEALVTIAEDDEQLDVERRSLTADEDVEEDVERRSGREWLSFTLPLHDVVDANKARRFDTSGKKLTGKKQTLRRGLARRLEVIKACFCGRFTGDCHSAVMNLSRARSAANRVSASVTAAATVAAGQVGDAPDKAPGTASIIAADARPGTPAGEEDPGGGTDTSLETSPCGSGADDSGAEGYSQKTAGKSNPRRKRKTKPVMSAVIVHSLPPPWLLRMCFPMPAAYSTVLSVAQGGTEDPSPSAIDAELRKHVSILKLFVMRTRSAQFARWSVDASVDADHVIEAAETMLQRLVHLRMTRLQHLDSSMAMDIN
ncbi:hypothetical protein I4F81_005349 [Pyropia yezoensis]|uniref:Uncharacterized protein n=1 Tax=Pyropia yezoensis TaxID=2788 RepID=A0ACC3BZ32_PYRYE|nr:hypothetical protein I4F81_005349 [Neopyropia yezoensis]